MFSNLKFPDISGIHKTGRGTTRRNRLHPHDDYDDDDYDDDDYDDYAGDYDYICDGDYEEVVYPQ